MVSTWLKVYLQLVFDRRLSTAVGVCPEVAGGSILQQRAQCMVVDSKGYERASVQGNA
jgi:hypothetical protein